MERAYTMADGGILQDPAVAGGLGAAATAFLGWLGTRLVGKAALQEAVNKGFHELMNQLRQELRVALKERDEARASDGAKTAHIEELQKTIAALELRIAACNLLPKC